MRIKRVATLVAHTALIIQSVAIVRHHLTLSYFAGGNNSTSP
jgi:hypothetical protein